MLGYETDYVREKIRGAAGTDFQVGSLGIFKYDDIKQIL